MARNLGAPEAAAFGEYLLGREIDAESRQIYARAAAELHYDVTDAATRFALRRPWSIGALDAALALTQPAALLRRKLLLMAAVLEARPEYCDAFLPRERRKRDALIVAAVAVRAALLGLLGLVLLPLTR